MSLTPSQKHERLLLVSAELKWWDGVLKPLLSYGIPPPPRKTPNETAKKLVIDFIATKDYYTIMKHYGELAREERILIKSLETKHEYA